MWMLSYTQAVFGYMTPSISNKAHEEWIQTWLDDVFMNVWDAT